MRNCFWPKKLSETSPTTLSWHLSTIVWLSKVSLEQPEMFLLRCYRSLEILEFSTYWLTDWCLQMSITQWLLRLLDVTSVQQVPLAYCSMCNVHIIVLSLCPISFTDTDKSWFAVATLCWHDVYVGIFCSYWSGCIVLFLICYDV